MIFPSHLSPTILSASINHIAPLFMVGANSDEQAARAAVTALLADYRPQTNQELRLAADIVHYRLLATDNLARSTDPDLPLTKVLRLRGSAVSLSREAYKAQRRLDRLQACRLAAGMESVVHQAGRPVASVSETAAVAAPAPPAAAEGGHPAPPTPAELAALQVARGILNGKQPIKTSKYGGSDPAHQLSKRAMVLTMQENAARNTAQCIVETAAVQAA